MRLYFRAFLLRGPDPMPQRTVSYLSISECVFLAPAASTQSRIEIGSPKKNLSIVKKTEGVGEAKT